jgi:hypothetical protein
MRYSHTASAQDPVIKIRDFKTVSCVAGTPGISNNRNWHIQYKQKCFLDTDIQNALPR